MKVFLVWQCHFDGSGKVQTTPDHPSVIVAETAEAAAAQFYNAALVVEAQVFGVLADKLVGGG